MSHKDPRGDTFSSRRLFDEALVERKLSTTSKSSVMTETRLRAGVPVAEWNHMTHRGVIFTEAKEMPPEEKPKGIAKPITEPGDKATVVTEATETRLVKGAEVKLSVPRGHDLAGVIGTVVDGKVDGEGMVAVKFPGTKSPDARWNLMDMRPAGKTTWATMMAEAFQRPRADAMLIEKLSGDTKMLSLTEVVKLLKSVGFSEKIVASALGGTVDDVAYYYIVTEAGDLFGLYGVRIVGGDDVYSFDTDDSGVFDDVASAKKEMAALASKPMTEQKLLAEGHAATAAKGIGKALWHASGAADIPALSDGANAAAKLRASRAKKKAAAEALRRRQHPPGH